MVPIKRADLPPTSAPRSVEGRQRGAAWEQGTGQRPTAAAAASAAAKAGAKAAAKAKAGAKATGDGAAAEDDLGLQAELGEINALQVFACANPQGGRGREGGARGRRDPTPDPA